MWGIFKKTGKSNHYQVVLKAQLFPGQVFVLQKNHF